MLFFARFQKQTQKSKMTEEEEETRSATDHLHNISRQHLKRSQFVSGYSRMLNIRVKGPSGQKTVAVPTTASFGELKRIISGQFPNIDEFDILTGFPPKSLISSPTARASDMIENNAAVTLKITRTATTSAATSTAHGSTSQTGTGVFQRVSQQQPPPGVDAESWASLPDDIRSEFMRALDLSDDDDANDDEQMRNPTPSGLGSHHDNANVSRPSRAPQAPATAAQASKPSQPASGLHFGARVATFQSGGESGDIVKPKIGQGSGPRTFGARVATLPKNTGGG